jgi:uncharacterized protein involved in response to NO
VLLRFHRSELERQRDMLRAVPRWYLLPLVPGIATAIVVRWEPLVDLGAAAIAFGMFYLIWRLNRWGAKQLDVQAQASALEDAIR